jgi:predicted Rossmann-fold nucleotide-binding protein
MIRSLCVFCGSSVGSRPAYIGAAIALGKVLAEQRIRLIYGSMGAAASA